MALITYAVHSTEGVSSSRIANAYGLAYDEWIPCDVPERAGHFDLKYVHLYRASEKFYAVFRVFRQSNYKHTGGSNMLPGADFTYMSYKDYFGKLEQRNAIRFADLVGNMLRHLRSYKPPLEIVIEKKAMHAELAEKIKRETPIDMTARKVRLTK